VSTFNFWGWVIFAILLGVAEILTGGFFMLPFACGAVVAAVVTAAGGTLLWQLVGFAATTGVCFIAARLYLAAHNASPTQPIAGNRLIDQTGIVVEVIDPVTGTGMVRVNRERWRADSGDGTPIPEGTSVRVTAIVGTHVVVAPISDESEGAAQG
jgi:membrane protein implicated in regulation of membrane protease activity